MPGGDGTGPFGTLRNCFPADAQDTPGQAPFYGRGFGRGFGAGFGRGYGRGFGRGRYYGMAQAGQQYAPQQGQQQSKENEIRELEQQMDSIKKRIEELKQ